MEYLAEHGVPTEVVPGITSALGAAATCQVPLTHRGFGANQVRFIVGQSKAKALPDIDWPELARNANTITTVFYMGLKMLDTICQQLSEHGAPADTPIVLIESATTPEEQAIFATVGSAPRVAKEKEAGARGGPVLIIMGPTAAFPAHLEKLGGDRPSKRFRASPPAEC